MCRVVEHPVFGLDCYPATIFTDADKESIIKAIDSNWFIDAFNV